MRAWIDGRLLTDPTEAAVRVDDQGLTVGVGAFEAVKVVGGRTFALARHLDRLEKSCSGLGITVPDRDVVRRAICDVLAGERLDLGRIRVTVTGGPARLGAVSGESTPTLIVVADAMAPATPTASVATVPWPRNERGALAGLKTTSYAENLVALAHAEARGATEAVFATTTGTLCEGARTNVFYVVDGELRTPSLASGCLPGVTRALVLEWFGAREVDEPLDVVGGASEMFLTSTTRDVQPVTHWDGRAIAAPGPVTLAAQQTWAERAAELLTDPADSE